MSLSGPPTAGVCSRTTQGYPSAVTSGRWKLAFSAQAQSQLAGSAKAQSGLACSGRARCPLLRTTPVLLAPRCSPRDAAGLTVRCPTLTRPRLRPTRSRPSAARSPITPVSLPVRCQSHGASPPGRGNDPDMSDGPPTMSEDWRAFRARLIQQQAKEQKLGSNSGSVDTSGSSTSDSAGVEELIAQDRSAEGASSPKPSSSSGTESWAHHLVRPETGGLVIARPGTFVTHQQYFNRAVIFLLHHSDGCSIGLILNKPTDLTLDRVEAFEVLCPELAQCRLYIGGDVGPTCTHVLHSHANLEGAVCVIPGVFTGGFEAIQAHVNEGKSSWEDYKWFHRYAGWGAKQLEREVEAGVWILASCSSDLILKQTAGGGLDLWKEVMELMGEDL